VWDACGPVAGEILYEVLLELLGRHEGDAVMPSNFLDRLYDEKRELEVRMEKLISFINNHEQFEKIPIHDQGLMLKQSGCMHDYNDLLKERIDRAEKMGHSRLRRNDHG